MRDAGKVREHFNQFCGVQECPLVALRSTEPSILLARPASLPTITFGQNCFGFSALWQGLKPAFDFHADV